MAIDRLQERIRKMRCPLVLDMGAAHEVPEFVMGIDDRRKFYQFCWELLEGLKGLIPAVRFRMATFALMGGDGITVLQSLLSKAQKMGYYVLLDVPEALSPQEAERSAKMLLEEGSRWCFNGLVVSFYMGSDGLRPYIPLLRQNDRELFAVIRTGNRSAPELQDLLTGGRLVHMAAADVVSRLADANPGRYGYKDLGALVSASSDTNLKTLREKYRNMFLLVDSMEYSSVNGRKVSYAFDSLGHGAAVCVGPTITGEFDRVRYRQGACTQEAYFQCAAEAVERLKNTISSYIQIR